jgi:Mn-dependent DtxR family transcriptional regulator
MLTQSLEDYLEAIKIIENEKGIVRVKDIGDFLNVKSPSVVSALNTLSSKGYIKQEKYSNVHLTSKGRKKAEKIYQKHLVIVKFLTQILKVPLSIAKKDACKIEHVISKETYEKILSLLEERETKTD